MNSSASVRAILIFVSAAALALWLGVSVATDQYETLIKVVAAVGFIICVLLGRRIWLLMILLVAMNVPLVRGISTVDIGQALFLGFSGIIFLMRRLPLQFKFGELEFWMLLVALTVVQVYLRNPVGLNIFGAGAVGARPYLAVASAWLTGALLSALIVPPSELRWAMRLTIIGSLAGAVLTSLRMRLGGGVVDTGGLEASTGGRASSRVFVLLWFAPAFARAVASVVSPLRACFHPLWAPVILLSFVLAVGSGYRNVVATVGMYYLIAIAYRGGFMSVLIASLAASFGLGALALFNLATPLPPNWQRALSPFPGTWEDRYVQAADESTEWRVEMWKEALFTDFWIQNKLLGDGLGFSRRELEMMETMDAGGNGFVSMGSGLSSQQEAMMIAGSYHSGPVQTIRAVGYVGLGILMLAMIRLAVHAHREILRCRGTEWFSLSLFMGIPSIALPIIFTFVFGEFRAASTQVFLAYGMITLMKRNLPLPAYIKPVRNAYILNRRAAASGGPATMPG